MNPAMISEALSYEAQLANASDYVRRLIRDVPDFPKPGILFRDITPVMADPNGFHAMGTLMVDLLNKIDGHISGFVGIESRGFILATPLAAGLRRAFIPARKPGKLPFATISESYGLEYGGDTLHMHTDAIKPGDRVVIVDDLLASGGTARAAVNLVRRLGGEVVACLFLIELAGLKGRERLADVPVEAALVYP